MTRSTVRSPNVALRAILIGTVVACATAPPASAMRGIRGGPTYTSPAAVRDAQAILVQEHYLKPGVYAKGDLDQPTIDAIREFQRDHYVRPSGQLDPETMGMLSSHGRGFALAGAPPEAPKGSVPTGEEEGAALAARRTVADHPARAGATRRMPATGSPALTLLVLGGLLCGSGLALLFVRRG
jgi:hypothetical protein